MTTNNTISLNDAFNMATEITRQLQAARLRVTTARSEVEKTESDVEVLENRLNGLLSDIANAQDQEKQAILVKENESLKAQMEEGQKAVTKDGDVQKGKKVA